MTKYIFFAVSISFLVGCSINSYKYKGSESFVNQLSFNKVKKEEIKITEPLIITTFGGQDPSWTTTPHKSFEFSRGAQTFPIAYDSILRVLGISKDQSLSFRDLSCFYKRISPDNFLKNEGSIANPEFVKCLNDLLSNSYVLIFSFHFDYRPSEPHTSHCNFLGQVCLISSGQVLYYKRVAAKRFSNAGGEKEFPVKQIVRVMKMLTDDLVKSLH